MNNQIADTIPAEKSARIAVQTTTVVVLAYIIAITGAEVAGVFIALIVGFLCHAILIPILLGHYVLMEQAPYRRILPALALIPLLRILSVTMPVRLIPQIYWYALAGAPLLVAIALTARLLALSPAKLGLRIRSWPVQILIVFSGLPLSLVAYLILRPSPLINEFNWRNAILGSILLIVFTGFTEEVLFRGLLHRVVAETFGRASVLICSVLFAIMYSGSLSLSFVLFIGVVGIFFALCTNRTGSIWGVALAHGLMNAGTALFWPFLFAPFRFTLVTRIGATTRLGLWLLIAAWLSFLALTVLVQSRRVVRGLMIVLPRRLAPDRWSRPEYLGQGRYSLETSEIPESATPDAISEPLHCSISEAARRLGISERTVRKRIKNGSLAAERSGGQWNVLLPPESLSSSGAAEITPPKPHGYVTPEAVEQALARAGGTFSGDLRAVSEELGRVYNAQLAARDVHLDELSRRMDSVERERDALAARLKVGESALGNHDSQPDIAGLGSIDWRRWQVWLTQVFAAILLGFAIVGLGDYLIRYDDIPLLPDARGPTTATPINTALPTSAAAAGPVTPLPSEAGLLSTPAVTPAPVASATAQIATPQIASNAALAPKTILRKVVRAEAALRTGQIEARVDYGQGANSIVEMRFDLGSENRVPRVDMTTIYTNSTGTEVVNRITVGQHTWQRRGGKGWAVVAKAVGVSGEIHDYLVHADAVASAQSAGGANPFELRWYDVGRDADVTLLVDSITGVPRQLRRVARDTGWILTVIYKGWNTPVDIAPPSK